MKLSDYKLACCPRIDIAKFITSVHYAHNVNGVCSKICFKVTLRGKLVGAFMFGNPAGRTVYMKLNRVLKLSLISNKFVVELRRMVFIDNTPRFIESYFLSRCLKYLKQHTSYKHFITYADPAYNHKGTVYQATNLKALPRTGTDKRIVFGGKTYHSRSPNKRNKRGKLSPMAKRLREAMVNGTAIVYKVPGKYEYYYNLEQKKRTKRGSKNVRR